MHNIGDEPLVSGLILNDALTAEEILRALLDGKKIRNINAPIGVNFFLKNGEIQSSKITYIKGIPQMIFNKDIKFIIDRS